MRGQMATRSRIVRIAGSLTRKRIGNNEELLVVGIFSFEELAGLDGLLFMVLPVRRWVALDCGLVGVSAAMVV